MSSIVRLRTAALPDLDSGIVVPAYDRGQMRVGIVHFGVGEQPPLGASEFTQQQPAHRIPAAGDIR